MLRLSNLYTVRFPEEYSIEIGSITAVCLSLAAFMREMSDLAVWDVAEIPTVVKSRHFVERRYFPPLWGSSLYPIPQDPTFRA